jgi:hypothetical protein
MRNLSNYVNHILIITRATNARDLGKKRSKCLSANQHESEKNMSGNDREASRLNSRKIRDPAVLTVVRPITTPIATAQI